MVDSIGFVKIPRVNTWNTYKSQPVGTWIVVFNNNVHHLSLVHMFRHEHYHFMIFVLENDPN